MNKTTLAKVAGAICISVALAPTGLDMLMCFIGFMLIFWAIEE